MKKLSAIIFITLSLYVRAEDFFTNFAVGFGEVEEARESSKEKSSIYFCDKTSDNLIIKVPVDINSSGNFEACLTSQLEDNENDLSNVKFDSTNEKEYKMPAALQLLQQKLSKTKDTSPLGLGLALSTIKKMINTKKSKSANCNCLPKNKLDEFLMTDYGEKAVQAEQLKIKEMMQTAYISKARLALQDVVDLEIYFNQNGIEASDAMLLQVKDCNINQYKKRILEIARKDCKGKYDEKYINGVIKEIIPQELENKLVSFAQKENLPNSCMNYETYKNSQISEEYQTIFSILNNRQGKSVNINEIIENSLHHANWNRKNNISQDLTSLQKNLSNSMIVRNFIMNKQKYNDRLAKYIGKTSLTPSELKEFAKDVNRLVLENNGDEQLLETVGANCKNALDPLVIKAAFCPSKNDIPDSMYKNLNSKNAAKIERFCKKNEQESSDVDDFGGDYEMPQQSNEIKELEEFYDPESSYFSTTQEYIDANKPKSIIQSSFCEKRDNFLEYYNEEYKNAVHENLKYLGISYGVCHETEEECKRIGYKTSYSNDSTTLEKYCKVTTAKDCEQKLKYVEQYINKDKEIPEKVNKFLDHILEGYSNNPARTGSLNEMKFLPSAKEIEGIKTSLEIALDKKKDIQPNPQLGTISTTAPEGNIDFAEQVKDPLSILGNQDKAPSKISDYAAKGNEDDYTRISTWNPDSSESIIYERKLPPPIIQKVSTKPYEAGLMPADTIDDQSAIERDSNPIKSEQKLTEERSSPQERSEPISKPSINNITSEKIIENNYKEKTIATKERVKPQENLSRNTDLNDKRREDIDELNKALRKQEDALAELKDYENRSTSSSSSASSRADDYSRKIDDLNRRLENTVNNTTKAINNSRSRGAISNGSSSRSRSLDNGTIQTSNQSAAPSSLARVDEQVDKIAESIKKDGLENIPEQLGAASAKSSGSSVGDGGKAEVLGQAGSEAAGRAPASLGGMSGAGGLKKGGALALDKIKFDESQYNKLIEDKMLKDISEKGDILIALQIVGLKLMTVEELTNSTGLYAFKIREYDLKLTPHLQQVLGVSDLKTLENRKKVNEKFKQIAKDIEKNMELVDEIVENFVVVEERIIEDKAKGLVYKNSLITKNELTESIKKFYGL